MLTSFLKKERKLLRINFKELQHNDSIVVVLCQEESASQSEILDGSIVSIFRSRERSEHYESRYLAQHC